jgi:hypothetical protein
MGYSKFLGAAAVAGMMLVGIPAMAQPADPAPMAAGDMGGRPMMRHHRMMQHHEMRMMHHKRMMMHHRMMHHRMMRHHMKTM